MDKALKTPTILLVLTIPLKKNLHAQTKVTGKVEYDCLINIGLGEKRFKAVLYCNADSNYFHALDTPSKIIAYNKQEKKKSMNGNFYPIKDTIGLKIISDKKAGQIFSREILFNKLIPVYEDIPDFKWVFLDESRKIGAYFCKKATCHFRGREYVAWYAPEIPVDAGPYKFQKLPGLIMEVSDKEHKVCFSATGIDYIQQKYIPADADDHDKPISRSRYAKSAISFYNNPLPNVAVRDLPKGTKMAISVKVKPISIENLDSH